MPSVADSAILLAYSSLGFLAVESEFDVVCRLKTTVSSEAIYLLAGNFGESCRSLLRRSHHWY